MTAVEAVMGELVQIEVPVKPETAALLRNEGRRQAVGRLVDMLVDRGAEDPLVALFQATSTEAAASGLTDEEVEEELVIYNSERRD